MAIEETPVGNGAPDALVTSDDADNKDVNRASKQNLIQAMLKVGARLIAVNSSPRTFGYYNPETEVTFHPVEHTAINMNTILDILRKDFKAQTRSATKWDLTHLFDDMPEVVEEVDACGFNPTRPERFPRTATSDGKPVLQYNTFNPEFRPITNTIAPVSAIDTLVGTVLYKSVLSSVKTIAHHSIIDRENIEGLEEQILSTFAAYAQPTHKHMRYAAVILGKQGSGKSILANLLANAGGYSEFMSINKLTGQFGSRWNTACTVVVDEATIENEVQSNQMKNFMTATTIDLEEKYKSTVSANVYLNFIFTTNTIDDFRTFETENRRYFVLTADGAVDVKENDPHNCITPRIIVTKAEYKALQSINEYSYNSDDGSKGFNPTEASDAPRAGGNHEIVLSQLGDIASKPTQYLGAFKVFSELLSERLGEIELDNLDNRIETLGQQQLTDNVPKQLGVKGQHDIVTNFIRDKKLNRGSASEELINSDYLNLNECFGGKFKNQLAPHVLDYFGSKFVYGKTKYSVITNDKDSLLIAVDAKKQGSSENATIIADARATHNSFLRDARDAEDTRNAVAESKVSDEVELQRNKFLGAMSKLNPNNDEFNILIKEFCSSAGMTNALAITALRSIKGYGYKTATRIITYEPPTLEVVAGEDFD